MKALLLITCLTYSLQALAADCPSSFAGLGSSDTYSSALARYRRFVKDYDLPEIKRTFPPKTPVENSALLAALLEKNGIRGTEEKASRRFRSAAKEFDLEAGITPEKLDKLINIYYLSQFGDPTKLRSWLTESLGTNTDRLINQKIEQEIARDGMEKALTEINALRPAKTWKEKLSKLVVKHGAFAETVAFGVQGALLLTIKHNGFLLPFAPTRVSLFTKKLLSPENLALAQREGLEALRPQIQAQFRKRAQAELYFQWLSKSYNVAASVALGYGIYEDFVEQEKIGDAQMEKRMEPIQDLIAKDKIAAGLLHDWEKEFLATNKVAPTNAEKEKMQLLLQKLTQKTN